MSDTAKKIAYGIDSFNKVFRQLLEAQPNVRGSITVHLHEGWYKCDDTTIKGKPEPIKKDGVRSLEERGITLTPEMAPEPQEGNS